MFAFYVSLAFKNLLRRKRRTLLTAAAIAVGILYFVAFDSLLSGLDQEAVSNMVNFETGSVQLTAPAGTPPEAIETALRDLASVDGVAAAAPRALTPAMLAVGANELPVSTVAVDPVADTRVFMQADYITAGKWLPAGSLADDAGTAVEPGDPSEPDITDTTDITDTSGVPVEPGAPDEPVEPGEPGAPGEPAEPDEPHKPTESGQPDTTGAPDVPGEPADAPAADAPAAIPIVLGERVADLLGLEPGDPVGISFQGVAAVPTADAAVGSTLAIVVGIVNTPHPAVNSSQVFVSLGDAHALAAAAGGAAAATVIAVSTTSQRTDSVVRAIAAMPSAAGWEVKSWEDTASFLAIGSGKRTYAMALLGLVMLIATIGVVNSILLSTMERTREIGILKAMGMTRPQIVTLFVMEGGGLGLLGGALGAAMSIAANYYLVEVGISVRSIMGDMDIDIGYPIANVIRGAWNWPMLLLAVLFGLAVSLIASYLPARRAASLDPVTCLRHL